MVIALDEVTDEPLISSALILVVVTLVITAVVYGAVALIVKMDDVGVRIARTREGTAASVGRGLVRAMPVVMSALSTVGIAAMLWVGGHILLVGLDDLGVSGPYDAVHHLEEDIRHALGPAGGGRARLTNTPAARARGGGARRGGRSRRLADEHRGVGGAGRGRRCDRRGGRARPRSEEPALRDGGYTAPPAAVGAV